ncbi:hypothetical protein GOP47_0001189 [Adiantum capillus-veneris]|uniref:Dof-type domain-containing protein n=1 Tax=Adiantum capillus-veneris TaxID=13818 RepID=A0A9D4VED1_ADICA|nr:hypothetical protein GOP47_0001189 [Adiantum capillus-veneris]
MAAEAKRAVRPHPQQMVKCPRCNSSETKFCYYNNYSTTQPRYFCKNCKRYWTDGGTLRNVPVGGGLRKNKRSKTKLAASSASPPPTLSAHQQKPSSSAPGSINVSGVNHSTIASHVGLPNPTPDTNHGLPHTPGYLVFNPRNYETDNQPTPITGQLPLYQQEVNYNHHIVPPPPLHMLAGGLKQTHEPTLGGTPYFSPYPWHPKDHERALSESMQPGGFHHSSESGSANYTMNNLVNVNDWQQISENLFGTGGEGNYVFMQPPPQSTHWADFDAGTRL